MIHSRSGSVTASRVVRFMRSVIATNIDVFAFHLHAHCHPARRRGICFCSTFTWWWTPIPFRWRATCFIHFGHLEIVDINSLNGAHCYNQSFTIIFIHDLFATRFCGLIVVEFQHIILFDAFDVIRNVVFEIER